jgi:hypothetical protein
MAVNKTEKKYRHINVAIGTVPTKKKKKKTEQLFSTMAVFVSQLQSRKITPLK